jgi:hypothetical protein
MITFILELRLWAQPSVEIRSKNPLGTDDFIYFSSLFLVKHHILDMRTFIVFVPSLDLLAVQARTPRGVYSQDCFFKEIHRLAFAEGILYKF